MYGYTSLTKRSNDLDACPVTGRCLSTANRFSMRKKSPSSDLQLKLDRNDLEASEVELHALLGLPSEAGD